MDENEEEEKVDNSAEIDNEIETLDDGVDETSESDVVEEDYNPEQLKNGFGRDEFAKRIKNNNYYKEEGEKLKEKQRLAKEATDKARDEKNKDYKKKDAKDNGAVKSDGSNTTQKNAKDKFSDNKNLAKAKMGETKNKVAGFNNGVNNLKSKAYAAMHPAEAAKAKAKSVVNNAVKDGVKNTIKGIGDKLLGPKKYIFIFVAIMVLILALAMFIVIFTDSSSNYTTGNELSSYYSSDTGFWWPIGSEEITTTTSGIFAVGDPIPSTITSPYGWRESTNSDHGGIDIDIYGNMDDIPIIASKSGTIKVAVGNWTSASGTSGVNSYGNYIVIDHGDSFTTYYAHLDSILVEVGDTVSQGQVIGYMGNTGNSLGQHLHFEVRIDGVRQDPENYVSYEESRYNSEYDYILNINLTSTSLSKTEFSNVLTAYCDKVNNTNCKNNFAANSDLIYETSIDLGINPELVVAYAKIEYGFACYDNNCWAIGHSNTSSSGYSYDTFADGIEAFSATILKYNNESSDIYASTLKEKEDSINAGCASSTYIIPNTLVWVQTSYSYIGKYMYNPGSSGLGGCYYLDYWADTGFLGYTEEYYNSRCGSANTCSSGKESSCSSYYSTTCELSDFSMYTAKQRADIVTSIFYN